MLAALMLVGVACDDPPPRLPPDGGASLELNPNGTTPLAAQLSVSIDEPSTLSITITGADRSWTVEVTTARTEHQVPLLGFWADASFEIAIATDTDGIAGELTPLSLTTAPLPAPFPRIVVESIDAARMEAGLSLLDLAGTAEYLVIVDETGRVVWLYDPPNSGVGDVRMLPSGTLLYLSGGDIYEMSMLGEILRRVKVTSQDADFHHEVVPTPEDTYLTLGLAVTEVADFHTSDSDPDALATVNVTDDVIVEVAPDGTVLRRHALLDILDPSRIGYDSLSNHFELGTPNDWSHANAVVLDGAHVLVSARHQDAVLKAERDTGDLTWILAPHDNWSVEFQPYLLTPIGDDFAWSYHQHAPQATGDGTLMLFDNGNHRASPYDGVTPQPAASSYSRAVEYRIDENAMTIEQIWEYGATIDPSLYGWFIGDADVLPETGNAWITFGGLTSIGGTDSETLGLGRFQSRLIEVTRDAQKQIVFELSISSDLDDAPVGFRVYRSERIPGLYPVNGL